MLPGFRWTHRLVQKCAQSVYLLDKNMMWKFGKVGKFLSGRNRGVPNHPKCPIWPPFRPCSLITVKTQDYSDLSEQVFPSGCLVFVQGGRSTQFCTTQSGNVKKSPRVVNFRPFRIRSRVVNFRPFLVHLAEIWIPDFGHLQFCKLFQTFTLYCFRADIPIPHTFVPICALPWNPVAYLITVVD